MTITTERLREVLNYNPETGVFTWREAKGRRRTDRPAGFRDRRYLWIRVDYRLYSAGPLAWLYMTGQWPKNEVDHRDRDTFNNRWNNLREATRTQNLANTRLFNGSRRANRTGVKGVRPARKAGRWEIVFRNKYVATVDSLDEARVIRARIEQEHYGEFANESAHALMPPSAKS